MPFQSQAQAGWAFSTGQPFARRWARQTGPYKRLPYKKRKDATTPTTTYAHGNGGLLSAPGLGGAKKRKPYKTKTESPETRVDQLWATGVKKTDIIGIWYSPSDGTWFVSGGDWAESGTGDKVKAVFGPDVIWADEGVPDAKPGSSETKFTQQIEFKSYTLDQLEQFVSSPHYDSATAAAIAAGIHELPRLKGESLGPGITRIHGNLCNVHGRYGPCDAALSGKKKPRKGRKPPKPKQTPAQRATARQQQRTTNADDVAKRMQQSDTGLSSTGVAGMRGLASGAQPPKNIGDNLVTMGLAEQATDGSYRMSATGRAAMNAMASGDYQRTVDTIGRAGDTAGARRGRQAAHTARQQVSQAAHAAVAAKRQARIDAAAKRQAAKKPAKAGASGGSKKPAAATAPKPIKAIARQSLPSAPALSSAPVKPFKPAAAPAPAPKAPAKQIAPALTDAAQSLSDGKTLSDSDTQALVRNGLAKPNTTGQMVLTAAGQRVTKKAHDDYPDQSQFAGYTMEDWNDGLPEKKPSREAVEGARTRFAQALGLESIAQPSSFKVFKDATGRHRWVAQSSTAFQDRDKEIVSTKALADDCRWADTHDNAYGPLRWWHTPGLDLGDCDFNAMHGRVLIESGTFRSAQVAQKVARAAGDLEISLGFIHLPSEPDASGVFHHIRRFERSLVPRGKASNRFTAFRVKESPMFDPTKVAALKQLGFSDADITSLQTQAEATEKAADAQQVAYKADEPELPDIILNGVTYKAFPPKAAPAADAEDAAEPPETPGEVPDAEDIAEGPEPDDGGGGLTLSPEDIQAIGQAVSDALTNALGPLVSTMDLTNKIGNHMNDLKTMMGGYQTKKDAEAAETVGQINTLTAKVAELTGDQPAAPYRPSAARDNVLTDATMLAAAKQLSDPNAADPWADIKQGLGLTQPRQ